jgi:phenylacetate-coenzyme A ligase PaaK-like adenylate-forming protein
VRDAPRDFHSRGSLITFAAATSGTSGTPLRLRRSLSSVVYEQAVLDRLMELGGADPVRSRIAVLRGDDVKHPSDRSPPYWSIAGGGRKLVFSSNHLDRRSLPHFLEALRGFGPHVLFAYPTVLDSLCSLMLERGESLAIPLTLCGSEVLSGATCEAARNALGTRVIGYYGQAERVGWAYGDPERGYRFLGSYSANELQRVESGDDADVYELIGTGLWNDAMPLVRYRTGDRFRLPRGSDARQVAAGRARLLGIVGRSGDYLVSADGARLMGIDHIPRNVPQLLRAQFIQESTEAVRLLVIPGAGFNEESRRKLLEHAALKLPPSMKLSIETTDQLVRNASGKAPLIVRRLGSA